MLTEKILDEKVISQRGRIRRIRRWLKGIQPGKGIITKGWSGWETVQEKDHIVPARIYKVMSRARKKTVFPAAGKPS